MASTNRPGVSIRQTVSATATSVASPTLVPVIIGPCFQIIDVLDSSGDLNASALFSESQYNQSGMLIPQASFPDPRDNIDELVISEDTIGVSLSFGGRVTAMARGSQETYGTSFLKGVNLASHAAWRSVQATEFVFVEANKTLTMSVDSVNSADTTDDLTVTFDEGTIPIADVVESINAIFPDLASVVTLDDDSTVIQFASETYGAASSITLRACGALEVLFSMSSVNAGKEYRIEGAGFRGQDDEDGDLLTPWIEFFVGDYLVEGESTALPVSTDDQDPVAAGSIWVGFLTYDEANTTSDDTFVPVLASEVTFTGANPTIPLSVATATVPGDQFWASGGRVGSNAEVIKAEENRFKLGQISTSRSTYDDDGVATNRVYTTLEINTIYASTPFAPKYAYFIADGLVYGEVDPEGEAAVLTGDTAGLAARSAIVQSSAATTVFPMNMGGLNLIYQMTVDGVQGDEETYTFAGGSSSLSDVASTLADEFGDDFVVSVVEVDGDNGRLVITSVATGAGQTIQIKESGTANSVLKFSIEDVTEDDGLDVLFASQAVVTGDDISASFPGPLVIAETFTVIITDSKGSHEVGGAVDGSFANMTELLEAVAEALGSTDAEILAGTYYIRDGGQEIALITADDDTITVTTIEGGVAVQIELDDTGGWGSAGFDAGNNTDSGADDLLGTTLGFSLDGGAEVYEVTFTSNSLADAIDLINETVNGSTDVASTSSDDQLVLTSMLVGVASGVEVVVDDDAYDADTVLGFSTVLEYTAVGTGRPNPDFYVDGDGSVVIGPSVLRGKNTGVPYRLSSALASVYIGYTALRLDVTASADNPAMLSFDNLADMEAAIGPISEENPLALGVYLAMLNTTTVSVSAIGIDEVNDAAPMGTLDSWYRVLDFLEGKEVYVLAPLTDDEYVQGLIAAHVDVMSAASERGERIVFLWSPVPDRAETTTVASGEGETNGTTNSFTLGENVEAEIAALGLDADDLSVDDAVYLELEVEVDGSSSLRRYSVSDVNGSVANLRVSFDADEDENVDSFYYTTDLDEELTNQAWSLKIRGDELLITGTTRPDLGGIATAAAAQGEAYGQKRVNYLFLASMDVSIDGVTANIAGYYMSCIYAGMSAQLPPQQPFSSLSVVGCGQIYGTDNKFSESQMDTIADGGRWIVINFGSRVMARHARSSSNTSIQEMEYSITKSVDWFCKGLRAVNRVFIGRTVITPGFLDQLSISNDGFCDYAEMLGVVSKADVTSLLQDEDVPTKVLIDVSIDPVYPCNTIDVTVVS